jgi:WD40 repeat protein
VVEEEEPEEEEEEENAFAIVRAERADRSDRAERTSKTKKKAGTQKKAQAGGPNTRLLLLVGGGVLLLVGGVVAAIVLSGGKHKETVQEKEKQEPKEQDPKPSTVPPKKDNTPKPPDKTPAPDPPPLEFPEIKTAWTKDLPDGFAPIGYPVCTSDSRTVVALAEPTGLPYVFDTTSGKPFPCGVDGRVRFVRVGALDKGGFAVLPQDGSDAIPVFDPQQQGGGVVSGFKGTKGVVSQFVSPNRQYVALGESAQKDESQPVQVIRVADGKALVSADWGRGHVIFTSDSSRVLIAEFNGKCRWHKLPSGEADGEWALRAPKGSKKEFVFTASSDGSVLLCSGALEDRDEGYHVIDGRTGRVLRSLKGSYVAQAGSLSADGTLALLPKQGADGRCHGADIVRTTTGAVVAELVAPAGCENMLPTILPDGRGAVAVALGRPNRIARFDLARPGSVSPPDPVSPVPSEPVVLKPRWTANTKTFCFVHSFTSDGKFVFSLPGIGEGAAFDLATGAPRPQLAELLKSNAGLVFPLTDGRVGTWTPDPNKVVIDLRDERTGTRVGKLNVPDVPRPPGNEGGHALDVSRNARYVAVGWKSVVAKDEMAMRVFDLKTNKAVVSRNWTGGSFHFTADSSRVLVAESNGRFRWYKLPSGEPAEGWEFAPSPQGNVVASASDDGSVLAYSGSIDKKWSGTATLDGKTGTVLHRFTRDDRHRAVPVAVSADGRRVLMSWMDNATGILSYDVADARTGAVAGRIPPGALVTSAALSRDGMTLLLASHGPKPTIQVFDIPAGAASGAEPAARLEVRQAPWTATLAADFSLPRLHVSADSKIVVVASNKGATLVLEAPTGKEIPSGFGKLGFSAKPLPLGGGRFAVVALTAAETIPVVDARTGQSKAVPGIAVAKDMTSQFVSPDERYVAVGVATNLEPQPFKLKDTRTGKFVLDFKWVRGQAHFTADSSRVLVAESSGRCRWFKLPSGELDREFSLEPAKVIGPAGSGFQLFAASADGSVLLYDGQLVDRTGAYHVIDGRTGRVARSLEGNYSPQFGSMSADGSLAVLAKRDAKQRLLSADVVHLATGTVVAELTAPANCDFLIPTILPDGSGAVALIGPKPDKVVRFDFVGAGAVGPKTP